MSRLSLLSRVPGILGAFLVGACSSVPPAMSRGAEPLDDAAVEAAGAEMMLAPDGSRGQSGAPPYLMVPDAATEAAADDGGGDPVVVYAQSGSDLFGVNPETLKLSRLGPLAIPLGGGKVKYLNTVSDIAIDKNGRILGVTYDSLLEIDPATAECKVIAPLPPGLTFNGLSFIRVERGDEYLVATTSQGTVHRIDPQTGAATLIGNYGAGLKSSGDIVSVDGYGTLGTVSGEDGDQLARIDPGTGKATVIGPIGFKHVWGIGFWKDKVFGFTENGEFVLIDPKTGKGTLVERDSAAPFWGAGVTTSVPVVIN
jgi:hypothetical protein